MKAAERLIDHVQPTRYTLQLEPDLLSFTFKGQETINFRLTEESNHIKFHAEKLDIILATCEGQPAEVSYNQDEQTATFTFGKALAKGEHEIELSFSGVLRDDLHGFYKSSYDLKGRQEWLATTQFEATYARSCFVCIDEPAAKAVFEASLLIPNELTAISNTNVKSETVKGSLKLVNFAPTPKMSTYLAAFLVGKFERKSQKTKQGVEVGVITTPGKLNQADFALDVAVRSLEYFTDYFGIPYPLPKLDMIAIPDFSAGAMENWGAVTYRETAILVDPQDSALANRQRVATVVAHELAHQWFGNLVTMDWWTDLWLNEGFATWVEFLAIDHLFPEWQMWTQFVSDDYAYAQSLDGLANTHPIEVQVNHPGEISEIFDAISYQKGASIIRQLHAYIGDASFRQGLHDYLMHYSYANASTDDLWQHLEAASNKPVREMMGAWTKQPGFPVISVGKSTINQNRFFLSPLEANKQKGSTVWPVPIAGSLDTKVLLLDKTKAQLPSNLQSGKLNPDQTAFYITHYEPERFGLLIQNFAGLSSVDRFGLINDTTSLATAGYASSVQLLQLILTGSKEESDYAVWSGLLAGHSSLRRLFIDIDDVRDGLDSLGHKIITGQLNRLGFEPNQSETHFDQLLRPLLIMSAIRFDDTKVIDWGIKSFNQISRNQSVHPDLRLASYMAAAKTGDSQIYQQLIDLYQNSQLQEEQRRLLSGLAGFKDKQLLQKTLELSLSEKVRSQESLFVILRVMNNRFGRDLAWSYIQKHWQELVKRYASSHMLQYIPEGLETYSDHIKADEIEEFFSARKIAGMERSVEQGLERIRLQAEWKNRDLEAIRSFLASR